MPNKDAFCDMTSEILLSFGAQTMPTSKIASTIMCSRNDVMLVRTTKKSLQSPQTLSLAEGGV